MRRRQILAAAGKPAVAPQTYEELARLYAKKFGSLPHHRMKRETIIERLNNASTE